MKFKVRFPSICQVNIGAFVQTRWGNDLVHLKVLNVITKGDAYTSWEIEAEIGTIDLDWYKE